MTHMTEEAAARQRKLIDDARRLLKPGEVKLHKLPSWLAKRLRAYRKTHALVSVPSSMLLETLSSADRWLDHWGTSNVGPFSCCHKALNFVSEPYDFGAKTAQAIDQFCDALGALEWHVSSNTWWYPGRTVRVTIHETHP